MRKPRSRCLVPVKAVSDLLRIGGELSNLAFNFKQQVGYKLTTRDTQVLERLQREWDATRHLVRIQPEKAR